MFNDFMITVNALAPLMVQEGIKSAEYSYSVDVDTPSDTLNLIRGDSRTLDFEQATVNNITSFLLEAVETLLPPVGLLTPYRVKVKIKDDFIKFTAEMDGKVNTFKVQFK